MKNIFVAVFAAFALSVGVMTLASDTGHALNPADSVRNGVEKAGGTGDRNGTKLNDGIKKVVNVLLFILGAIAVIMMVIGGLKYTISNGDSSQVTSAKNTILYAAVGLVVALLAYAIVNFVIAKFGA